MGGFNIDWTINVSNILTILGFAGAGLYAALKAKETLLGSHAEIRTDLALALQAEKSTSDRLQNVEKRIGEITDATIQIARQDERMKHFDHRLSKTEEDLSLLLRPQV